MSEEEKSREITPAQKPNFLQNALRTIKGENDSQLIERFTAEMTLVAEGLSEDQSRLDREMELIRGQQQRLSDDLTAGQDRAAARLESEIQTLETELDSFRTDTEKRLSAMEKQLAAMEKKAKEKPAKETKTGLIRQLTYLVAIAGGCWVVVTLLKLFQ